MSRQLQGKSMVWGQQGKFSTSKNQYKSELLAYFEWRHSHADQLQTQLNEEPFYKWEEKELPHGWQRTKGGLNSLCPPHAASDSNKKVVWLLLGQDCKQRLRAENVLNSISLSHSQFSE